MFRVGNLQTLVKLSALEVSIVHIPYHTSSGALALLSLLDTFRYWQSDWVECRRFLRGGLAIAFGAFVLFIVVIEFKNGLGELPMALNYVNITIISIFSMVVGHSILVSVPNIIMESLGQLIPELVKDETPKPLITDR